METLFKYISYPWDIFENGFIRATQLSAINDPFESALCHESLNELIKHFEYETTFDPETGAETSFFEYINKYKNRIGIISLSETDDNLLMWSHYANEHKGLVIGFRNNPLISLIKEPKILVNDLSTDAWDTWTPPYSEPQRVIYRKRLKFKIDKFYTDYSNIIAEGAERLLFDVFLQKSDEWQYEKEHRVLFRLEQADKVIIRKVDIDGIESPKIKQIIFNHYSPRLTHIDGNDYYEISLCDGDNKVNRLIVGKAIANFSTTSSNIYLFKLNKGSIGNCIFGVNSSFEKENILQGRFVDRPDVTFKKAKINGQEYCLDFDEL